jgi:hypothetical protein
MRYNPDAGSFDFTLAAIISRSGAEAGSTDSLRSRMFLAGPLAQNWKARNTASQNVPDA